MRVCSAGEKNSSYIRIHGSSYQDSFAQSTRGYGEGLFYESPKGPAISPPHPLHPPPPHLPLSEKLPVNTLHVLAES